MKRLIASFGWLMLLLPLISVAGVKTVISTINIKARMADERQVSGFTGISSSGAYDVFIKMDGTESLRLEGDAEEISNVETIVENGILKIRYKKDVKIGWRDTKKVNIYISAKELNNLTLSGSGSMKIDGTVKTNKLQTKVSGSGNIALTTNTDDLLSIVSGSGSITVSGSAKTTNVAVSGSGNFKGKELRTNSADIKVSGSGNASIYAEKNIQAAVSGSGNINYSGNASVSQTKSGSGRISKF